LFKHFKETEVKLNTPMNIDKINGGTLLSIQSPGLLSFYSWDNGDCIRCMEINAKNVSFIIIIIFLFYFINHYNNLLNIFKKKNIYIYIYIYIICIISY